MISLMVKAPKDTEVLMFGDKAKPAQRAEIISFDENGKAVVEKGGVSQTPMPSKPKPKPTPAPAAVASPKAPAPEAPAPKASAPKSSPPKSVPKVSNPASAKEVSQALAVDAVGSFVDQIKAAAEAKGGMLSLQDIDAMQSELANKTREMEHQFEAAFEHYAEAREKMKFSQDRTDPFFRLLVKQFSPMFVEPPGRKTVCRRMLPGFFMAVGMLLGPDAVENHHDRCRAIVARLKEEAGDDAFDWETFYADRDALTVLLDALLLIAAGFRDYDRRQGWFLTLVNSHLKPVDDTMSEAERRWELAEPGFRRFMDAMMTNLRKVLSSDKGRARLIKRHGQETVAAALVTLKRLLTG